MTRLLWPQDVTDPRSLGGKAAALWRLGRAGFPVPAWFVVPVEVLQEELGDCPLEAWPQGVQSLVPSEALMRTVMGELARLSPDGRAVAVRSSGSDEDGATHSFAGQFESVFGVDPHDPAAVARALLTVWRSGCSDRVRAYRREHGLTAPPTPPAVLVQRMVVADAAGVAFSADPVSGRRGVAVVSAVPGLGSVLVGGEASADTYRIDRGGQIIERTIVAKTAAHHPTAAGNIQVVRPSAAQAAAPALTDAQALAVAQLARRAAAHFGRAQDIEWAFEAGTLHLLQSRPITAMGRLADPDGGRLIWDNSNIAESYAGVTTPLTFTFARHAYEHVYRQFCRLMGVRAAVVADHAPTFANMIGIVHGRVYYNLINWYRMLALLPGFAVNRRFMEQMMGVKEGLPEEIVAQLRQATWGARLGDALRLSGAVAMLAVRHLTLGRAVRRFYARLEGALATPNPPLEQMRLDELAAHYRGLERRLLTRWDAPLVNDFLAMIFYGTSRKLAGKWCGDADGTLQNDLICGQGDIISAEPPRRLRAMAQWVAAHAGEHPGVTDVLCTGTAQAIDHRVAALGELRAMAGAYLERFGDRCLEELKLESGTLHDDPLPMWRSIGQMARRLAQSPAATPAEDEARRRDIRAAAEARVRRALRWHPWRGLLFAWVIGHARGRVRDRENLRFERTRLFGRVRRIMLEVGRRLHEIDRLDAPRDVFYLHVDEVLGFVEGTATTLDLRGLARVRQAEYESYRHDPSRAPANRFETRGAVHEGNAFRAVSAPAAVLEGVAGDARRGIGCCPGVVRGPVRVITDPRAAVLQAGEILVAARTDPGWVLLFPAAAGVLVEHGSLLSHSAIVARELGIPGVVSVPGLTDWLTTGDVVELDGATGLVRRIPAATAQAGAAGGLGPRGGTAP